MYADTIRIEGPAADKAAAILLAGNDWHGASARRPLRDFLNPPPTGGNLMLQAYRGSNGPHLYLQAADVRSHSTMEREYITVPSQLSSAIAALLTSEASHHPDTLAVAHELEGLRAWPLPMDAKNTPRFELRREAPRVMTRTWLPAAVELEVPTLEHLANCLCKPVLYTVNGSSSRRPFLESELHDLQLRAEELGAVAVALTGRLSDTELFAHPVSEHALINVPRLVGAGLPEGALILYDESISPPVAGYVTDELTVLLIAGARQNSDAYRDRLNAVVNAAVNAPRLTLEEASGKLAAWTREVQTEASIKTTAEWVEQEAGAATERRLENALRVAQSQSRDLLSAAVEAQRKAGDLMAQLSAARGSRAERLANLDAELRGLRSMLESGALKSVSTNGPVLQAHTSLVHAQDERTGEWHELGEYTITISLNPPEISFYNKTRQVDAYSTAMQHPHVWHGGDACPGNFAEMQSELMLRGDWLTLLEMSLAFLQHSNTEDGAGRYLHRWPHVENPEERGLPIATWGTGEPYRDGDDDGEDDDTPALGR